MSSDPAKSKQVARSGAERGYHSVTLHVGTGFEDDSEADALVTAILDASAVHGIPLYIETHRATITQDPWRTLQLIERHPDIRFTGDFSHWYTGVELVYGDLDAKLDALQPVFERVRFLHGRIGTPGAIQVDVGDGTNRPYVEHFQQIWSRVFSAFLACADPDERIVFAPELLSTANHYALQMQHRIGRTGGGGRPLGAGDGALLARCGRVRHGHPGDGSYGSMTWRVLHLAGRRCSAFPLHRSR